MAAILLATAYNALLGKGIFGTANPPKPAASSAPEVVPTFIIYEEALEYYKKHDGLFIDARHEYDYGLGHITGSLNLPLKEFETRTDVYSSWPKDKLLIVYCDGEECNSSIDLAKKFSAAGFTNVKIFFGGWTEWQQHHDPTEK